MVTVETDGLEALRVVGSHRTSHYEYFALVWTLHSQGFTHADAGGPQIQRKAELIRHPSLFHLQVVLNAFLEPSGVEVR